VSPLAPVVGNVPVASSVAGQTAVAVGSLVLVVVGGKLFATGTEWVSDRLDVGRNVAGAVFAALATGLPETIVPVLAVLQGSGASVGVGAILGGPVSLTTLAVAVLGASASLYAVRGVREPEIVVDERQVRLDLRVFTAGFSLAAAVTVLRSDLVALVAGGLLVALYLGYLYRVSRADAGDEPAEPEALEFGKWVDAWGRAVPGADADRDRARNPPDSLVALQLVVAVGMLLVGSHLLVGAIEWASATVLPVPSVIVALLVVPVASNLPENVDGVVWIARNEDCLAVEQVTGTLAYQGTVVVAVGVLFTPWELTPSWGTVDFLVALSVGLALLGGATFYLQLGTERVLRPRALAGQGLAYLAFLGVTGYYLVAGYL